MALAERKPAHLPSVASVVAAASAWRAACYPKAQKDTSWQKQLQESMRCTYSFCEGAKSGSKRLVYSRFGVLR